MSVVHLLASAVPRRAARIDLLLAAAMPLVLVAGWAIGDSLQPAGYDPVRQSISVAAGHAGHDRWVITSALLAVGVLYLLIAAALPLRRTGRLWLALTGVCGLGVALAPEPATGPSPAHEFWSVLGALFLMLGPAFTASLRPAALGTALFAALTLWLLWELRHGTAAGLAERLTTTAEVTWPLALVSLHPAGRVAVATRPRSSGDRAPDS